jgi:23S rRNA (cytosine1962-C5)-methyltransferase
MPVNKKPFDIEDLHPFLSELPCPSERRIALRVGRGAKQAVLQGHPWLFEGAIQHQSHAGKPGDLAVIFDQRRKFLAVGLYDPYSSIRVRILQHSTPALIDQTWFETRLGAAVRLRAHLLNLPPEQITTGYRLVHGENDGLPGLIIDRYEDTLVIKLYTSAWIPHFRDVITALQCVAGGERLILRLNRALLNQAGDLYGLEDGMVLYGSPLEEPVIFTENGLRFEADLMRGQKTGFFFDQRDNRAGVERLSTGKKVLDVFAYTGAFSVYAARGGAQEITSIDTSQPALEAACRNMSLNLELPPVASALHETITGDAFKLLSQMGVAGRRFDLVIIDPPAFAQKQSQISQAVSAYQRLTQLGLSVLQPGGTLVQASCSSRVTDEAFYDAIHGAAQEAGRLLRELDRSGHPIDHPVRFKEGAYLKCLFAIA